MTEGFVNKLKLIKRQGYWRVNYQMTEGHQKMIEHGSPSRKRVLLTGAAGESVQPFFVLRSRTISFSWQIEKHSPLSQLSLKNMKSESSM
jgi:hypothetical protein